MAKIKKAARKPMSNKARKKRGKEAPYVWREPLEPLPVVVAPIITPDIVLVAVPVVKTQHSNWHKFVDWLTK